MTDTRLDVRIEGFDGTGDPSAGLQRLFGVDALRANRIVAGAPITVKRRASPSQALRYAVALRRIGARVVLLDSISGDPVNIAHLAAATRAGQGRSRQPDPPGSGPSRGRDSSGFDRRPRTAHGLPPVSATAPETADAGAPAASAASGGSGRFDQLAPVYSDHWSQPRQAVKAAAEDRAALVSLEKPLGPPGAGALFRAGWGATEPPAKADDPLELDERDLPRGRTMGGVPPMPPVLSGIEDFEADDWSPTQKVTTGDFEAARTSTLLAGAAADGWAADPRDGSGERRAIESRSPLEAFSTAAAPPTRAAGPRRSPAESEEGRRNLVIGVAVAAAIGIGVVLIARLSGGVSSQLEGALEEAGQTFLPSMAYESSQGGSLAGGAFQDFQEDLRLGRCYGWIATTESGALCDLDLYLERRGQPLFADVMLDSLPVVFHCADEDGQARLRLSNASSESCSFGLARFGSAGSVGWPLEPYLRLYTDYLNAATSSRYVPVSQAGHGAPLSNGAEATHRVTIPEGHCYNVLAVSQQGTDLDMELIVDGRTVDDDRAGDNYPIVGYCADGADAVAEARVFMYSGASPYVWHVVEGPPLR